MSALRCKMCGGTLELMGNATVAVCEYCGSKQTIPKLDDEKRLALFDRANYYRSRNEFDKASVIYENILSESADNAEAHWGICLCRYGIEYVNDPKTNKRIPTCHRTQFKSILEDADYLTAIENSDMLSREIYREEAEYIDSVQKNILSISSKEEPFDIFICYKETDEEGNRTVDSVIAQEIYDELTAIGYKVFFSRITLEDKLGVAYEPYIFAALTSAQLMLIVGTKSEYFEAVWVKNEWSRFLSMIEQGQRKTIVPCYRNVAPEDMPAEFAALQGQDVSKVGWKQDLMRGIGKILPLEQKHSTVHGHTSSLYGAQSTVNKSLNAVPISTVTSAGANHANDFWPKSPISSTINKSRYPFISFQLTMQRGYSAAGNVTLKYKIYDDTNNLIAQHSGQIHVERGNDRLAQLWTIVGNDGTSIGNGIYRAVFTVDDGAPVEYNFRIVSSDRENENTNDNFVVSGNNSSFVQNPPVKKKSKAIYLLLCLFLGVFGIHSFYAGKPVKGVIQLMLVSTGISTIWMIFDLIKGLFVGVPKKKK